MAVHNRNLRPLHRRRIEQVELAGRLGSAFQLFRAGLGNRFGQRLAAHIGALVEFSGHPPGEGDPPSKINRGG